MRAVNRPISLFGIKNLKQNKFVCNVMSLALKKLSEYKKQQK